ncbi:hypothetical protein ACSQ76_08015 [Roseovarius sp. B08]|uniref:hypothetical protein n=1 Tax=Roseovarius sp. B08 TaxID=3449223 RepID=UPI003EDC63D7
MSKQSGMAGGYGTAITGAVGTLVVVVGLYVAGVFDPDLDAPERGTGGTGDSSDATTAETATAESGAGTAPESEGKAPADSAGSQAGQTAETGTREAEDAAKAEATDTTEADAAERPEAETADTAPEMPAPPKVNTFRLDPDGQMLVAGRAEPGWETAIRLDRDVLRSFVPEGNGEFVEFVTVDPSEEPRVLSLSMRSPETGEDVVSEGEIIIAPLRAPRQPDVAGGDAVAALEASGPEGATSDDEAQAVAPADTTMQAAEPVEAVEPDGTSADTVADAVEEEAAPEIGTAALSDPAAPARDGETSAAAQESEARAATPEAEAEGGETGAQTGTASELQSDSAADGAGTAAATEAEGDDVAAGEAGTEQAATTGTGGDATAPDNAGTDQAAVSMQTEDGDAATGAAGVDQAAAATGAGSEDAAKDAAGTEQTDTTGAGDDETVTAAVTGEAGTRQDSDTAGESPAAEGTGDGASDVSDDAPGAAVLMSDADGVRVIQPAPGDARPDVMSVVALDAISYSDTGEVELSGRGAKDGFVRVYLDNTPVTTSRIEADGSWQSDLPEVDTGVYTLRIDEVDADGNVTSRVETPFKREDETLLAEATQAGKLVQAVTVQPGYTLWGDFAAQLRRGDRVCADLRGQPRPHPRPRPDLSGAGLYHTRPCGVGPARKNPDAGCAGAFVTFLGKRRDKGWIGDHDAA